ncbi:MAG: SIS domain-containing protein [Euryarchaeota archaeon]|nr:SIS domain-containing protein [Euryarchaeota archaeon]
MEKALKCIPKKAEEKFVETLLRAKRVFVYGVGRSGLVAQIFSVRLVQLGIDTHFVGDATTPILRADDFVLVVSGTGSTMSAIQTANIAGRVGASVAAITTSKSSKLAHAAGQVITIKVEEDGKRARYAPLGTIFEIGAMVFLDTVITDLMARLGQDESAMKSRHAIWV